MNRANVNARNASSIQLRVGGKINFDFTFNFHLSGWHLFLYLLAHCRGRINAHQSNVCQCCSFILIVMWLAPCDAKDTRLCGANVATSTVLHRVYITAAVFFIRSAPFRSLSCHFLSKPHDLAGTYFSKFPYFFFLLFASTICLCSFFLLFLLLLLLFLFTCEECGKKAWAHQSHTRGRHFPRW